MQRENVGRVRDAQSASVDNVRPYSASDGLLFHPLKEEAIAIDAPMLFVEDQAQRFVDFRFG